jgi:hypothetical protein
MPKFRVKHTAVNVDRNPHIRRTGQLEGRVIPVVADTYWQGDIIDLPAIDEVIVWPEKSDPPQEHDAGAVTRRLVALGAVEELSDDEAKVAGMSVDDQVPDALTKPAGSAAAKPAAK